METVATNYSTARGTPRWIVAQEGSRQSYAIPLSFHRLNMLKTLYVDTWCRWGGAVLSRLPGPCRALATHFTKVIPSELIVSFNRSVLYSRAIFNLKKARLSAPELSEEFCRFGEKFAKLVLTHLKHQDLDSSRDRFFGFNTNCLETLIGLREQGIFTVVDQVDPGKVEEDLCLEEAARWPGWARVQGKMSPVYWDRLKAEWQVADLVLVNSEWSASALLQQGIPQEKLIVVPLAWDTRNVALSQRKVSQGTLRVLWLGSVILRKGIQYLVQAARLLERENIEFIVAGPIGVSAKAIQTFPSNIELIGSVTRDRVAALYRQADVFVLPTLSDGFAITQLEAMTQGLPVVTTPNCGKVVSHGKDGLVVPARDAEALSEAILSIHRDRRLLQNMSINASRTARKFDLSSNAALIDRLVTERSNSKAATPMKLGRLAPA